MSQHKIGSLDVSRETFERLKRYESLLYKWNPRINLVAKSTLADAWNRHFVDSAQVVQVLSAFPDRWLDLGTGGGFPGLVAAIIAAELAPGCDVTLVESDARKSAFLRTVIRETGIRTQVENKRIEALNPAEADLVSARALASIDQLLGFCERHLRPEGRALFLKGERHQAEIEEARKNWHFKVEEVPSQTSDGAVILLIGEIRRV
ncbi:16S rRNA methyltransferase [Actibacterium mucosum KCTC 23349]|uniref:Ribosomal RNA small subunit methyltransferase G n=1 Tax=Actibacterium mucosum KCTC 23349 TaxID=1454373 RepID=A0A037ZLB9_9RHOB|nr:16S rRNA (guanine(527)-N(7))-methyltransferase RsmG [Actibacterium mucosum]KAJ57251.1 16S rRNA methyltransferase [Actibacterium mucosum KCTC 23349]